MEAMRPTRVGALGAWGMGDFFFNPSQEQEVRARQARPSRAEDFIGRCMAQGARRSMCQAS